MFYRFQQGQVLLRGMSVIQHEYCIEVNSNNATNNTELKLLVCNDAMVMLTRNYHSIRYTVLPICMFTTTCETDTLNYIIKLMLFFCRFCFCSFNLGMLMSVLFLIITLVIYGCIPSLQNLNGKCLLCYLATLAFGYTILSGVQLNSSNYMQPLLCDSVGYLVYFTLFSAFLWLSVINFDLWLNLQWV